MQKLYTSKDPLEFNINNKWLQGELHTINPTQNIFEIKLQNSNTPLSQQSTFLQINTLNLQSILSNSNNFNINDKVEFYDDNTNGWQEGKITNKNGDFYIVNYLNKKSFDNSKILYKNNLRPLTKSQDIIKFNLDCADYYELKDKFGELSNPEKCVKKLGKQLIEIFGEEIKFIYVGDNLEMIIFKEKKNKENNNSLLKKEIIEGLIEIAKNHFEELEHHKVK